MHSPYMTLCPGPGLRARRFAGGPPALRLAPPAPRCRQAFNTLLKVRPASGPTGMRALLGLAAFLLLTVSLAGCLERRGTLAIDLLVSDGGDLGDFQRVNFTLREVRIDARTLNPETTPSRVERMELVSAAASGDPVRVFEAEVRADRYDRIQLIPPPGATFQGTLRDGTPVAVVVPNNALVQTISFEVPRGGGVRYLFVVEVREVDTGVGQSTYQAVPLDAESGPR